MSKQEEETKTLAENASQISCEFGATHKKPLAGRQPRKWRWRERAGIGGTSGGWRRLAAPAYRRYCGSREAQQQA